MTVKEMIALLSTRDPDTEVVYLDSSGNYRNILSAGVIKDGKLVKISEEDKQNDKS